MSSLCITFHTPCEWVGADIRNKLLQSKYRVLNHPVCEWMCYINGVFHIRRVGQTSLGVVDFERKEFCAVLLVRTLLVIWFILRKLFISGSEKYTAPGGTPNALCVREQRGRVSWCTL